jgi:hypothetical protein
MREEETTLNWSGCLRNALKQFGGRDMKYSNCI